jgi:tripartite-type tricarboxylate transporter receptor subunit TctC
MAPFYAVFVPTGTPQAIVDKLADALSKGLNEDAVKKRLAELGAETVEQERRGPKALTELIKAESARLLPILKAAAEKEK